MNVLILLILWFKRVFLTSKKYVWRRRYESESKPVFDEYVSGLNILNLNQYKTI